VTRTLTRDLFAVANLLVSFAKEVLFCLCILFVSTAELLKKLSMNFDYFLGWMDV